MEPNEILAKANAALEVTGDLYAALKVLEQSGHLVLIAEAGDQKAAEQATSAIEAFEALDLSDTDELTEHPPIAYFPDVGDEVRWVSLDGTPLCGIVQQLSLNPLNGEAPFFLANDHTEKLWGRLCDLTEVNGEAIPLPDPR